MNEEIEYLLYSKERLEKKERELEGLLRLEVERLRKEIETVLRLTGVEEEEIERKVESQLKEVLKNHPKGEKAREIAKEIEKIRQKIEGIEKIFSSLRKR
jgi:nucleotidyltransferase/DNA polymerase involved in DNA repair